MNQSTMNQTRSAGKFGAVPRLFGAAIGVTLLFAGAIYSMSPGAQEPDKDGATAVVARGEIEDTVSSLGFLQPREFVDLGTQVSGQLKQVLVAVGDTVKRGSLVAEIEPAVFAAKVEAGRATLRSLKAQLAEKGAQHTLAVQQFERNSSMYKQDATSKDAVQISQAATRATASQMATLRAQLEQTQANLKVEEANLNYTRIYSPMSGTVVALLARQGQTLNANQQAPLIMRVADLDTMTVVTQVSEADVSRVKPNMNVYFSTLGRPDRRWTAKVRQILPTPETVNNVVLYSVLFDVENADRELRTQMSAQVFFVIAQAQDALLVPMAALRPTKSERGKKAYAARVLKNGQIEEREVSVGIANRLSAQVLAGLNEGEQVLLERVADGKGEGKAERKSNAKRTAKL